MVVISVTPDLALDMGYTYAGGLGVLEGDKFYAAAKLGLDYIVFTLLYKNGYVSYRFSPKGDPIPQPQPQPKDFIDALKPEDTLRLRLKGEDVCVVPWSYELGSAKAIFFEPTSPEWASKLVSRLYIESSVEERFYKYTFLAKSVAAYIRRNIDIENIKYIDLQEAYTAILPLILKIPGKYRLIIHTPGPWGHPAFPKYLFEREFGYRFIGDIVVLTEVGLAASREAVAVSAKHFDIMSKVIPHFLEKIRYVTNGVNIDRWMDPYLRERIEKGNLSLDEFIRIRRKIRTQLIRFLRQFKEVNVKDKLVLAWCRRLVTYKRPDFMRQFIEAHNDLDMFFILGGKAHPYDGEGLRYMKIFHQLHEKYDNVIYLPEYTVDVAKLVLKGVDLLLFTPFPAWEASGTSFMKAGLNGVPTLASRDGAVIEFVIDNVNGWLFGEDLRDLIDMHDPRANKINEREYSEFEKRLLDIHDMYHNEPERYYQVSLNALRTFLPRVSIERTLKEYYPDIVKGILF